MSPWQNTSGQPIVDDEGRIIECDDCPCDEDEAPPCNDQMATICATPIAGTATLEVSGVSISAVGCAECADFPINDPLLATVFRECFGPGSVITYGYAERLCTDSTVFNVDLAVGIRCVDGVLQLRGALTTYIGDSPASSENHIFGPITITATAALAADAEFTLPYASSTAGPGCVITVDPAAEIHVTIHN